MRIGHGYDVHRLVPGRKLMLGGVEIPGELGTLGHSDGDAPLHALIDAMLGACAMGDIGKLFPDGDDAYLDIDSKILLKRAADLLRERGYEISNADVTIILQRPKLAPHIEEMRRVIALEAGVPGDRISVKATTEEKLGFTGSSEGVAAHAVVLMQEI